VNLRRGEQPRRRRKHIPILDANVLLIEMAQCGQMFPKRPGLRGIQDVVCEPLTHKVVNGSVKLLGLIVIALEQLEGVRHCRVAYGAQSWKEALLLVSRVFGSRNREVS
jgi:hypothetical protein